MTKTRAVQVRLSRDQHARIKHNSDSRGFPSLAAYLRYVALDQDFVLLEKVCEIHRHLLGDSKTSRGRNAKAPGRREAS